MAVYGIVAEYNPFHNGHKYHIDSIRQQGADHIIAVLSSSFVQRGEVALLSKYTRAAMAAVNGVDLVLELPVAYSLGSAERFAAGAVSLLDSLSVVDTISFGSECGDISRICEAAVICNDEQVASAISVGTEAGESWPVARRKAVAQLAGEDTALLLDSPNNVLGIEYCKALMNRGSTIGVHTIPRAGTGHDAEQPADRYSSAMAIRRMIADGRDPSGFMPPSAYQLLCLDEEKGAVCDDLSGIERLILHTLRSTDADTLSHVVDCTGGLANRILREAALAVSLEDLYSRVKTKRYTLSRIRRAVLCAVLNITASYHSDVPYAHILAIGKGGRQLLGDISRNSLLPVSESLDSLAEQTGFSQLTAELEMKASGYFALAARIIQPAFTDRTTKLFVLEQDIL